MTEKRPTEQELESYMEGLLDKFKQDPQYELSQELGRMLMRNIDTFTPQELSRYNELNKILKP